MTTLRLRSAAKINLTLGVGSRRADGYHEIDSIVQTVGLWDELILEPTPGAIEVRCNWPRLESGRNLVARAAELLRDAYRHSSGARIRLRKVVPTGAGLGGGSANAAAALVGLARLWELSVSTEELIALGQQLGADVPLFLSGGLQRMQGIGERLTPLPPPPSWWTVIVKPRASIATSWAYEALDRVPQRHSPTQEAMLVALREGNLSKCSQLLSNDFEEVVHKAYPSVAQARQGLREAGVAGVMMTGSGSAVFGLFASREECETAMAKITGDGSVFLAPFCRNGWEFDA